jgi:hypothetical protein
MGLEIDRAITEERRSGGLLCLILAADLLRIRLPSLERNLSIGCDLGEFQQCASERGLRSYRVRNWEEVDSALSSRHPVVLMGDSRVQRAHGKRLGIGTEGLRFLLLSDRTCTVFPTTGGPFATETVSYLTYDPQYQKEPVWLCLGELRGFCDAAHDLELFGVALHS